MYMNYQKLLEKEAKKRKLNRAHLDLLNLRPPQSMTYDFINGNNLLELYIKLTCSIVSISSYSRKTNLEYETS